VIPVSLLEEADKTRHEQSCQNAETETDPRIFQRGVAPVFDPVALFFRGQIHVGLCGEIQVGGRESHRAADGAGKKPVFREKEESPGVARKEIKHKTRGLLHGKVQEAYARM